MDTPIYWQVARDLNMPICGSRGPRIGDEGTPFCKRLPRHNGNYHYPDPEDGWGPIQWIGW